MQPNEENELTTLEEPATNVTSSETLPVAVSSSDMPEGVHEAPLEPGGTTTPTPSSPRPKRKFLSNVRIQGLFRHFNIYLLIFIVVLAIAVAIIAFAVRSNSRDSNTIIEGGSLSEEELADLRGTDARVGDPKQTLSIESNSIFTGKVLIRDSLDVAGTIKVGGSLNLPGITVSGNSAFDQVQAAQLNISGATTLQGQVNIQQNLTVSGSASFGGAISAPQLNIQTLQLSGDLQLNRHIDAGGSTPGRSNGGSLGSGGSTSVSGSDTAGTATINTGSGPSAGCYITVNFAQRFNSTPHVVITPVGSGAADLRYYINRSNTSFSICATNSPPASSSFSFDYIVID